ncbi:hypothetical protein MEN95_00415 [Dolichospermum sp. ST_sed7]|nr:hypothetical protein [Dolichospermum sp. ST_sed7]
MTLSSFDEIAKYLEQHENSQRIKKLIFFACKNEWENDQDTLNRFKLQELIQELSSLNPTIDHLNSSLSIAVKSLSKPKQYSIIASIIIKEIKKLYVTSEEQTGIILNPPHQEEQTGIILNPPHQNSPIFYSAEQRSSNPPTKTSSSSKKSQYNQFDLRQNLMRLTNPLRVKIILFSALYRKFTFSEEDWLKLKTEKLDSLLQLLFNSCSTIRELESKINNAVISLGKPDKNARAAGAIIRVMRVLYSDISTSLNSYKPPNSSLSKETSPPTNFNYQSAQTENDSLDGDDNNTCQLTVPHT